MVVRDEDELTRDFALGALGRWIYGCFVSSCRTRTRQQKPFRFFAVFFIAIFHFPSFSRLYNGCFIYIGRLAKLHKSWLITRTRMLCHCHYRSCTNRRFSFSLLSHIHRHFLPFYSVGHICLLLSATSLLLSGNRAGKGRRQSAPLHLNCKTDHLAASIACARVSEPLKSSSGRALLAHATQLCCADYTEAEARLPHSLSNRFTSHPAISWLHHICQMEHCFSFIS